MLHHMSNCSLAQAMDGSGIISSCQSAAVSETVKALLVMCGHVSSAISSIWCLPFIIS